MVKYYLKCVFCFTALPIRAQIPGRAGWPLTVLAAWRPPASAQPCSIAAQPQRLRAAGAAMYARKVKDLKKRLLSPRQDLQREALLDLTKLLAEVDDQKGVELLRLCEKEGVVLQLVNMLRRYLAQPSIDAYLVNLVLSSLTNLAFFGGISAIHAHGGLEVRRPLQPCQCAPHRGGARTELPGRPGVGVCARASHVTVRAPVAPGAATPASPCRSSSTRRIACLGPRRSSTASPCCRTCCSTRARSSAAT